MNNTIIDYKGLILDYKIKKTKYENIKKEYINAINVYEENIKDSKIRIEIINKIIKCIENEMNEMNDLEIKKFEHKNGNYITNDINSNHQTYQRNTKTENNELIEEINNLKKLIYQFVDEQIFKIIDKNVNGNIFIDQNIILNVYEDFIKYIKVQPFYVEKIELEDKKYDKDQFYQLFISYLDCINDHTSSRNKSNFTKYMKNYGFILIKKRDVMRKDQY
jgi:hypothetical protein